MHSWIRMRADVVKEMISFLRRIFFPKNHLRLNFFKLLIINLFLHIWLIFFKINVKSNILKRWRNVYKSEVFTKKFNSKKLSTKFICRGRKWHGRWCKYPVTPSILFSFNYNFKGDATKTSSRTTYDDRNGRWRTVMSQFYFFRKSQTRKMILLHKSNILIDKTWSIVFMIWYRYWKFE